MSKKMICSRATEDIVLALWCAWEWPQHEYIRDHHILWLDTHCAQYWYSIGGTLYFQHEADLQAWSLAHSQEPALTHKVLLGTNKHSFMDECRRWCEQQWGPDLFSGGGWPQGTWTYGYVTQVGTCMQFANQEQAVQFALLFT